MRTLSLPNVDAPEPALSAFELRRFVEGECTPARRAEIEALLVADASLRAQRDALEADIKAERAAFELAIPKARFLADHAARTTSPLAAWFSKLRMPVGFGALACGAAAVFFMVRAPDPQPYDGLKGDSRIGFFVKSGESAHVGVAGEPLHKGEQIQFAVRDDERKSVMVVVGVDGRGQVTVYAKEKIDGERAKGPEHPRVLESSVVLDDSTGAERFFVVYGDGDVNDVAEKVREAARALAGTNLADAGRLPLDAAFIQSSVHILKVQ